MSNKDEERVLVMDENLLYGFQGLNFAVSNADDTKDMGCALKAHGVSSKKSDFAWLNECVKKSYFMPRGIVEGNPSYKQLIPYIIVRSGELIFAYQRAGNEHRLTGQYSIGVGGHTNVEDFGTLGFGGVLKNTALRELKEELDFGTKTIGYTTDLKLHAHLNSPKAILYAGDSESIVNHVHFGIVYIVDLSSDEIESISLREEGKILDWMTKDDLYKVYDQLEEWSKLVLDNVL